MGDKVYQDPHVHEELLEKNEKSRNMQSNQLV